MSRLLNKLTFIVLLLVSMNASANEFNIVTVSAGESDVKLYEEILNGLEPYEFNNFKHPKMDRGIADFFLMSRALHLGGYKHRFKFIDSPNYARSLFQVTHGASMLMNQSVWLEDTTKRDLYISEVVIENGWFQKGIYVLPGRVDLLNSTSVDELKEYQTISSSNWVKDWKEIKALGLKTFNISMDTQMFKMLKSGRVDYLFLYFSKRENLVSNLPGYDVVPVEGMKLVLYGTRHFIISKKHTDSQKIALAMEKGIKLLKQKGMIKKAMIDSGFINPQVESWKAINPQN